MLFTAAEVRTFLAAAQKADAITDPVQRCLAYPDPPRSHWSHATVAAYCHDQLVTALDFGELKAQIEAGHGKAMDDRMADLLHEQIATGMHGVLDATYELDFDRTSGDIRPILDAWKRQSPQSSYAYAVSGVAYVRAALDARGSAWAADTPQSNFDAMTRLSTLAAADLDRAVSLNPQILPAYAAMIRLGGYNSQPRYALAAADRALAIDPSDYLVWSRLTWLALPKWGGSITSMRKVIADSQKHAKDNPLLILIRHQADVVAAGLDDCGCNRMTDVSVYPRLFDQVIAKSWLGGAGINAEKIGRDDLAVIYLSEALRFSPECCASDYLVWRSDALTQLGNYAWAVADANRAIRDDPTDKAAWTARGLAHQLSHDDAAAEADFKQALVLVPADDYSLRQLGMLYMAERRWEDGWNTATELIANHPDDPDGWIIRASIQKDQPRPGLDDTIRQFLSRFGNDPDPEVQVPVAQMRARLTRDSAHH